MITWMKILLYIVHLIPKSQEVAQRDSGQNPMEYENYLTRRR